MSDNTQDSASSRKGKRARFQINGAEASASLKNGLSHFSETLSKGVETFKEKSSTFHDKMATRDSSVYSKGVRELDDYGYERFNIGDDNEIFISKISDKAFFNDGEPVLVRATGGNFVGSADVDLESAPAPQEVPAVEDARDLFKNVPAGTAGSTEFHALCGVNNNGHIEPTVDNSFLKKMSRPVNVSHQPSVGFEDASEEPVAEAAPEAPVEAPADAAEEVVAEKRLPDFMSKIRNAPRVETPVEAPVEELDDEDEEVFIGMPADVPVADAAEAAPVVNEDVFYGMPADVPVADAAEAAPVVNEDVFYGMPAEAPAAEAEPAQADNEEVFIGVPAQPREEFFVDADEEEPEVLDCDSNVEVDDYDWFFEDEEPVAEIPVEAPADVPVAEAAPVVNEDVFVGMPADVPVEEPVAEAPVEEPVAEAEPFIAVAGIPVEIPVEAPVEEAPVEEPAQSVVDMDEVIGEMCAQASFEQASVSATIEGIVESEMERTVFQGLHLEGNELPDAARAGAVQSFDSGIASAATSAAVSPAITPDGGPLPPMSNPKSSRPKSNRAMRFKFNNGVLLDVKEESKEGLQSPLE